LAGPAIRDRKLVEILPGWGGIDDGGVFAIMPPGRLVPTKTRVFVDAVAKSIKRWRSDPTKPISADGAFTMSNGVHSLAI
jgi:hypothetical protein